MSPNISEIIHMSLIKVSLINHTVCTLKLHPNSTKYNSNDAMESHIGLLTDRGMGWRSGVGRVRLQELDVNRFGRLSIFIQWAGKVLVFQNAPSP